ncbi:helix-turn-helix domain-containing protein [Arthrobacter sp. ov118]|uniref:helix-turn-helix domain-containing protein n=1 Tax=Arthrobacter sp. ov118 TaxID=1761747 RepID=UPI0008F24122|nr:helix-turn-helix domain-containing protein [Arthrobacter sp. ov118]SFT92512.1 DNA binding domain-containing protein, excisionase family [Arthrobacter sp. ov118]
MARDSDGGSGVQEPDRAGVQFPRMLTLTQVKEILNVGTPTIYALLASQELRGVQLEGRRVWRVSHDDLADYLGRAYAQTKARIEVGQLGDEEPTED